ncbi:WbqC family protein [Clostridium sp. D2Q-11]|uniref:WbqC family protein n=1 Tax=Anaeromonas frigoriresistens TaxID=2683708 RepID=A0A942UUH6_9FIRM|nr:WbqC family protein [Anaeromonas frigoriresistens]MBS4538828.1 WbqC family protein [Anaeromonas frigoriresistens]
MIVSLHQPNYIPWLGYFYKIYKSDIFIIADDLQYIKRGYINRNQIKTPEGLQWLTIPVDYKYNLKSNINEVHTKDDLGWKEKHLRIIEQYYKRSKYFDDFFYLLKENVMKDYDTISDLNINILKMICEVLDIKTEMILLSDLDIEGDKSERIVNICKYLNADTYLSGHGAKAYNDLELFDKNNINLVYSDFQVKEYKQLWGEFIKNMSVIDYIFNCGFDIKKLFN